MSKRGRTCECGATKRAGAEACDRCTSLDGASHSEQAVVSALRSLGGEATTEAILHETGLSYRTYRKAAAQLERSGRVAKELVESWQPAVGGPGTAHMTLHDVTAVVDAWMQMQLPRLDAYLEPSRDFDDEAGSRRMVVARRAGTRQRAQMAFRFRKRRRSEPSTPERAAA